MSADNSVKNGSATDLEIIEFYIDEVQDSGKPAQRLYFGVNVAKVLEVIENEIKHPPKSPPNPCFLGTIPLRERILPVLDLSVWLGVQRRKHEHEVIMVTDFNELVSGFLVSGVTTIHNVAWKDVEPPSRYIARFDTNCVNGVVQLGDHFAFLLDFDTIIADLDPEFMAQKDSHSVRATHSYRALVAEDSNVMRNMLSDKMQSANFVVQQANTGEEAWTALERLKDKAAAVGKRITEYLDIVVTDVEMPRMDGITLTKKIKADPALKMLPVVLFSSLVTEDFRHVGEEAGADDQVTKPEFNQLAKRAIDLIEKRA